MQTAFPSYLTQQPQQRELQQAWGQIPGAFNTSGVEQSYQNQMGMNLAQAKTTTGAMARAAEGRAFQSGGKVGASFAAGDAMLPYFQQNQQQMGDLADYKLRAAQSRIQAMGNIGGMLANNRQQQQGMLSGYDTAAQVRAQQGGQFDANLAQQAAQFRANNALQLRGQAFNERQYRDSQDQLQLENHYKYKPGPSFGDTASAMAANNSALGSSTAFQYWQQLGAGANAGGYSDNPMFSVGDSGYGGGGGRGRTAAAPQRPQQSQGWFY